MKFSWRYTFLVVTVLVLGVWGVAVNVPNTFAAGDVISSAQVNANFDALETAVTANETAITSINTSITNLNTSVVKFGSASFQDATFDNQVDINSTAVLLGSVVVPELSGLKVNLSAHLVVEATAPNGSRYDFFITSGDCTNTTLLGRAWWRDSEAASIQSTTLAITAFDTNVTGPKTYVLCGQRFSGAVTARVYPRGITATWTP